MQVIDGLIEQLLQTADEEGRGKYLAASIPLMDPDQIHDLAAALKERVISYLRKDADLAMASAELVVEIANIVKNGSLQALGWRLVGQVHLLAYGEINEAMNYYAQALELYDRMGDIQGRAETAITHVWALAELGRYEEALQEGSLAIEVLQSIGETRSQATLQNNLAMIHRRVGNLPAALSMLEESRINYQALGEDGQAYLTNNAINRAFLLCDMGRFSESIQASAEAQACADKYNQEILKARISHNLGLTYKLLGRYNLALQLLENARDGWSRDSRQHELSMCDVALMECMLELGKFETVVEKCGQIQDSYHGQEQSYMIAQSYLNQARAEASLGNFDQAFDSLNAGKRAFPDHQDAYLTLLADLIACSIYQAQERWLESEQLGLDCQHAALQLGYPSEEKLALLYAGWGALHLGEYSKVKQYAKRVVSLEGQHHFTALSYRAYYLIGRALQAERNLDEADAYFRLAVRELERLQGNIMVEYRSDFLAGDIKKSVFESCVSLSLERGMSFDALDFVERAKSRALMDIITHRIDLRLHPRSPADEPFIRELNDLITQRNTIYRSLERRRLDPLTGSEDLKNDRQQAGDQIRTIERRINEIRQNLLVAHADYAEQPGLFQEPDLKAILQRLPADTALIEYFIVGQQLVAFLVTSSVGQIQIQPFRLSMSLSALERVQTALRRNISTAAFGDSRYLPELTIRAKSLLHELYNGLLGNFAEKLEDVSSLVIVPHGPLHYLPFHALHDGRQYLIETHQVSYLPSSSLLGVPRSKSGWREQVLSVGYSYNEELPQAVQEAVAVGRLWSVRPLLKADAKLESIRERITGCRLFHCASHGEFNADRSLFSGVALSDGWLTTLEIFNLRLSASLVTLSACDSGMNVVGGGEELFGLMRAFFVAGAASLLLSHWAVNDRSASIFMQMFYRNLKSGQTKAGALRVAQRALLDHTFDTKYEHPYFWAPFFLVGHAGLF